MKTLTYEDYLAFEKQHTGLTKREAVAKLAEFGYTKYDTGQCGDGGYGTREYFKTAKCPINQFGIPQGDTAEISKLGGLGWFISIFNSEFYRKQQSEKVVDPVAKAEFERQYNTITKVEIQKDSASWRDDKFVVKVTNAVGTTSYSYFKTKKEAEKFAKSGKLDNRQEA